METSGELLAPSPEERIRAAAIGHLLDAECGQWGRSSEQLESRVVNFYLDVIPPEEDNALNIIHLKSSRGSLYIGITQFKEDLAATLPMDTYKVVGLTFIKFPDPFDAAVTEGDTLSRSELHRIAEILEHDHLEELNLDHEHDTFDKTLALIEANSTSFHLFTNRQIAHYEATAGQDNATLIAKAKRIASRLRRILRF